MQAQSVRDTTNWGPGAATYNVTTTHTFASEVKGVSIITAAIYNTYYSRWEDFPVEYKYTIGGTGNKTVTVTSLVSGMNTSETGYVDATVTALL